MTRNQLLTDHSRFYTHWEDYISRTYGDHVWDAVMDLFEEETARNTSLPIWQIEAHIGYAMLKNYVLH